ncbi:carboxylesterase 4A-like isoform X1 [Branchiostoma lanceolatum]|uniref:carboxylesterase 4A-like isoform X1 n=1 Tax=Branchiostoma lanceolatum TaxID=7740 RepID=UPI0034540044
MFHRRSSVCLRTFVLFLLAISQSVFGQDSPTRVTESGTIMGSTTTVERVVIERYLGVPYAMPPFGNLRFLKPQAVRAWEGVKYANDYGDSCMQFPLPENVPTSEDCLYLNVFVPRVTLEEEDEKMAVMVYIHGGRFNSDTAASYNGEWLAAVGGVIVVTVNYRLSVFGFLSTGDRTAPGNYGLMDQQAAIQWVKDNIDNFGGDANRITLFGESAGGASVSMQMLSPQNTGLFQRAICQSGVAMSPGMINPDPLEATRELCEYLNCRTQDPVDMVTVLRRVSANELAQAAARFTGNFTERIWTPVIDGDFLPDDPVRLLERGSVPDRQLLLGFNEDEGAYLMNEGLPGYYIRDKATYNYYMNASLFHIFPTNTEAVVEAVALEYGSWNETSNVDALQQTFTTMYGDFAYIASTMQMANLYRQLNMATFVYQFTHARRSNLPAWAGAAHADELYYLFPTVRGNNPDLMTDDEMQLVESMMTYWSNFAKTGNPNLPYNPVLPTNWPRYTSSQRFIDLTIRMSDNSAGQYIRPRRTFFWTKMMPALDSQSCSPETTDDQDNTNTNPWLEETVLLGLRRNDLIQLGVVGGIAILLILVFFITCITCCKVLSLNRMMRYDDSKIGLSSYA